MDSLQYIVSVLKTEGINNECYIIKPYSGVKLRSVISPFEPYKLTLMKPCTHVSATLGLARFISIK